MVLCSHRLQTPHLKKNLAFASCRLSCQRQSPTVSPDGLLAWALTHVSGEVPSGRAEHSLQVLSAAGERGSSRRPRPGQSCRSGHLGQRNNIMINARYWMLGVDSTDKHWDKGCDVGLASVKCFPLWNNTNYLQCARQKNMQRTGNMYWRSHNKTTQVKLVIQLQAQHIQSKF